MSESSTGSDLTERRERGRQGALEFNRTASRDVLVRVERMTERDLAEVESSAARHAFVSGYLDGIRERIAATEN